MDELFFTREMRQIFDIQKMYPETGVCNIGGVLTEYDTEKCRICINAMKKAFEDTEVYHIQIDKDDKLYLSKTPVEIYEWKTKEEPDRQMLECWMRELLCDRDAPLYEIRFWTGSGKTKIYVKIHHLLADSYSLVLTVKRYMMYQDMFARNVDEKIPRDLTYIETMTTAEENSKKDIEWFRRSVPKKMPSEWSIRKSNPENISANICENIVPQTLTNTMKKYARENNISVESIIYGVLSIYYAAVTRSDKVCFGRSMLNRRKKDMESSGLKANQMPVFIDVAADRTFVEHCREINRILYDMMRHSSASFVEYLRKENQKNEYYDTAISYRNERLIPGASGVPVEELDTGLLELPMRISINDKEDHISVLIQYQSLNYTAEEIDLLYQRLLRVLEQGLQNVKIEEISILASKDMMLWHDVNSRAYVTKDSELLLLDLIQRYSNRADLTAISYKGIRLTYQQLWEDAGKIANWLLKKGVGTNDLVGIKMKVSEILPVVFIGVWRANAAFLPIADKESEERTKEISNICKEVITWEMAKQILNGCFAPTDTEKRRIQSSSVAYGMFTSGSTGTPKLVLISHGSLAWRVCWMVTQFGDPGRVLQKTPYTFDVSMWEFFLPLISGNVLSLMSDSERAIPSKIASVLISDRIETVHFVPSVLELFLSYVKKSKAKFPFLRNVYSSGEALSAETVSGFYKLFPKARLYNLYGPTECTIDVTYYTCTGHEEMVPIGRPLPGTEIDIVDKKNCRVPVGIEGQLVIGGNLVGTGYYGSEQGGFCERDGKRIYYTGDRAHLGYDGNIYYCGRNDRQCKIHGVRVDLRQIEENLMHISGVISAAVINNGDQMAAFYTATREIADISEKLSTKLPVYGVPSIIYYIQDMPLTPNGKTDYRRLSELYNSFAAKSKIERPKNADEKAVTMCITRVIGRRLSVNDNIFLCGVDSLKLIEILMMLDDMGYTYTPEEFYQHKTVHEIVKNRKSKVQWLCKREAPNLLIAFPFAAGTAEAFRPLAKMLKDENIDIAVARSGDLSELAGHYQKVILLGYCTGTALALHALEKIPSHNVEGVILCAALPPSEHMISNGSPWQHLSDKGVVYLVRYLHRKKKMKVSHAMVRMFRKDTDDYVHFFNEEHHIRTKKIVFLFGEHDILTVGCKYRWREWARHIRGSANMVVFKKEHHFFIKTRCREIAEIVKNML